MFILLIIIFPSECTSMSKSHNCMDINCPQIFDPVCGSDGMTYGSDCSLKLAACQNPFLTIIKQCEGQCPCHPKGTSACPQACPKVLKPVCGSNGKTYDNDCELERAACENPGQNITMVCWGNCPCHPKGTSAEHSDNQICPQVCLTEWKPVCGSNGKTYGNDCELERASCQNPFETITKQCEGQCPCSNCPRELVCRGQIGGYSDVHVCGSDGVQYRDQCHLQITACQNPKQQITMKCIGGCPCRPEPPKAIANSSK